jgi:hypothetical protein
MPKINANLVRRGGPKKMAVRDKQVAGCHRIIVIVYAPPPYKPGVSPKGRRRPGSGIINNPHGFADFPTSKSIIDRN